jgi:tetratricopeptide (TPR) repeat protein
MNFAGSVKLHRAILLFAAISVIAVTPDRGVCRAQSHATPDEIVSQGVAALERGDLSAARDLFQKALSLNPQDATPHTYLGVLADRAGNLEEAARHFARAASLAPSAKTRNNYGAILLRLGRTREAAIEFEASLKADPRQLSALVNLAQIRFEGGTTEDLRAAADLFARAYAIAPDADIARALIVVSLRRKDHSAIAALYKDYAARLAGEGGGAAGNARARAELGGALFEAGFLTEAETELTAAAKLAPADADAVVQLARVYLARKDIPAAGRTLEAAVARGLDPAPVYALLAQVYEQVGRLDNAIPAMRLAIQRDPESEKYRFAYGLLLMNAYAPAAAVIRIEEALKIFPNSPRLWFALGLAQFKRDDNVEAERVFKRVIEMDPNFAPAFAYLGMARVKEGSYDEGVALYEKALQIDPKLGVVDYLIAEALLSQAGSDAARIETHLKRAVESDGTFIPARLSLAKLHMRASRWTEAVAELEQVIRLDPDAAEAYYHLGRAYMRLKRRADADTALATFKRLSETQKEREDKEVREIVKRLANVRF